jgi:hypothetical protein
MQQPSYVLLDAHDAHPRLSASPCGLRLRGETHDDDDRLQPWRQGPESSVGALTGEKRESVGLEGGWNRLQTLKLGYRVRLL